jgi:hypothetical protein
MAPSETEQPPDAPPALLRQTQAALLSAYPDFTSLAQMVRFEFKERLREITPEANLTTVVFGLLEWAEARGRLRELVLAAHRGNPGNPKLLALLPAFGVDPVTEAETAQERACRELKSSLVAILAVFWRDPFNAAEPATQLGLTEVLEQLRAPPLDVWRALVEEAHRRGRLLELVEILLREHFRNPKLQEIRDRLARGTC